MRVLTGTDIIEIERIKENIEGLGDRFIHRIYTPNEINYCESKKNVKYQHYAGRFAAKEAIYKALSDLLKDKFELTWKDAEIKNDENGKPFIILHHSELEKKIEKMDISISHCKSYATANVVVITKE